MVCRGICITHFPSAQKQEYGSIALNREAYAAEQRLVSQRYHTALSEKRKKQAKQTALILPTRQLSLNSPSHC